MATNRASGKRATTAAPRHRPTVLVTGASAGIGEALARRFAREGFALVLVARRVDKLDALAARLAAGNGVKCSVIGADLSAPDAAQRLATALKRRGIEIDVLVNNAGVLEHGAFVELPAAAQQAMIALNVQGLTAMLSAFLPGMVRRGHGRVLNVASIAAFQPIPSLATYAATKAFVLSLTESLSEELSGSGVSVTALCPGITATGMLEGAAKANPLISRLPALVVGQADEVADEGFKACMAGDVVCVPGGLNLTASIASRVTPRWLLRKVAGAVARRAR
jgi:uncharacterized protein